MSYRTEKTEIGQDIVIQGWNEGVQDNPYEGIYDMRNCDAVTIPGEVSVAMSTQAMNSQAPIVGVTTTVQNILTYTFTYNGAVPLVLNTAITFSNSGGALPNGLSANTAYYILTVDNVNHLFTVSNTAGGTVATFSDYGSGTTTFSTINMGTPKFFSDTMITGINIRMYFMLDSFGRAWVLNNFAFIGQTNGNLGTWVYMSSLIAEYLTNPYQFSNSGNGMVAWNNNLFLFGEADVRVMRLKWFGLPSLSKSTNVNNWIQNWQATTNSGQTGTSKYAYISVNDSSIYFCNVNTIGGIFYDTSSTDNPNQNPFWPSVGRSKSDGATTNGSPTITSATMAFTNADIGSPITGTNIPANSYIGSINSSTSANLVNATGTPVNATNTGSGITFTIPTTWTFTNNVLPLPNWDIANCIGELGSQLMIGGINNYVYPWDRVSPNFSTPIFLSEYKISRLITVNTTMYIFCGNKGRIFVTNGANATPFYKIPDYLSLTTNPYFYWTDATFNRNQIYFGFRVTDNANNTLSTMGGLWAIDVDSTTPTAPRLQNIMSYGTYAGYVSAIHVDRGAFLTPLDSTLGNDGYGLYMGWWDGVTTANGENVGNIDVGISAPYLAGQSFVDTDPVPIGQYLTEKTLSGLEYKLGQPLASGESVAIAYRTQLSGAYTDNPLDTYITGNVSGWGVPIFEKSQWVQFRVTLTSTATNPSYCRVREIRLHLT